MNTTVRMKASQITKNWHVIDAAGRPLGRVATEAATLLRGKHKPTYEPHLDDGDFVIVVNASKVRLTGKKAETKTYYRHSGYPGGLRARSFTEQLARFPDRVIEQAVWGMLPGGPLGEAMLRHLKVYAGPNHPHQSQIISSEKARESRAAELAGLANIAYRPKRLRPLSVPTGIAPAVEAAAPSPVAAEVARKARARVAPKAAGPVVEAEEAVAEAPATAPGAPASDVATPVDLAPAETAVEATTEAPAKPARRRTTKTESSQE